MRLYSYIVRYDIGFAPNPFHGWCTLATCKPDIRNGASVGDWIAGVGSRTMKRDGRLVFAMQVDEKLTFDEYWNDSRFQRKKPDIRGSMKYRYGDNIYHRDDEGSWHQSDSRHSLNDGTPNEGHVLRDTGSNAVLASRKFSYWGGQGPAIPNEFRSWDGIDFCRPGRNHQWKPFPPEMTQAFINWVETLASGCQSDPSDW